MTDAEADAWFLEHAVYEVEVQIGFSTFGLRRNGGPASEGVGFIKPDSMAHPNDIDARRFLVRWFISVNGE